jgi:hypothetical protein
MCSSPATITDTSGIAEAIRRALLPDPGIAEAMRQAINPIAAGMAEAMRQASSAANIRRNAGRA